MTSNYDLWKTTDKYDTPDPLEGKPLGKCTWCGMPIVNFVHAIYCPYDDDLTEPENRIRYAAQRLEESAMWNKIAKEGGEA